MFSAENGLVFLTPVHKDKGQRRKDSVVHQDSKFASPEYIPFRYNSIRRRYPEWAVLMRGQAHGYWDGVDNLAT